MSIKKIVITGGPGTGKTSIIQKIAEQGFHCFEEISREVTLEARKEGIEQLFLTNPLLFSERILEGRTRQFQESETLDLPLAFFDRGIPDVQAYMDCFGETYGPQFEEASSLYRYDLVFLLPPWKDIHTADEVRYESYEEALRIHHCLDRTYSRYGYKIILVPKDTVAERVSFIHNTIKQG